MLVTGSYFPVLGLTPALGRLLNQGDDGTAGEPHVVVLSYEYWRTRFGERRDVLNQPLIVNGHPLTIVGVAPRGFTGTTLGSEPHVFVPMTLRESMESMFAKSLESRRSYWAYAFARLKPGVSAAQAAASINVPYAAIVNDVEAPLQKGMSDQTMKQFRARKVTVQQDPRGQSSLHQHARIPLVLLLSVTGLVLLIACANIANLLLARAAGRSAEMAVRLSIGASRWRLVRQLLAEAGLLAALGGALGLLVARWTLDLIISLLPAQAARYVSGSIDGRVVLFAAAVAAATALLFGLFPALHSTKPNLVNALKGQQGQPSGARSAAWFRSGLVTAQVALSMLLLAGAGLFVKSLFNVSRVELGVKADHIATFGVSPQLNGYTAARSLELFERLEDELGAVPGVTSVTASMVPLLAGSNWGNSLEVEGFQSGPDTDTVANFNKIGPGYFRTLGVPLIVGREFTREDAANGALVTVVNEQFTRKFNLGRNALGKHIQTGRADVAADRNRGRGGRRQVQRGQGRAAAAVLHSLPPGRDDGLPELLREDVAPARADPADDHEGRGAPRSESPCGGASDVGGTDPRQRLPRSAAHGAVGVLRGAGDATRGGRSVRSPGLHGGAADTRDRASDGTRGGA